MNTVHGLIDKIKYTPSLVLGNKDLSSEYLNTRPVYGFFFKKRSSIIKYPQHFVLRLINYVKWRIRHLYNSNKILQQYSTSFVRLYFIVNGIILNRLYRTARPSFDLLISRMRKITNKFKSSKVLSRSKNKAKYFSNTRMRKVNKKSFIKNVPMRLNGFKTVALSSPNFPFYTVNNLRLYTACFNRNPALLNKNHAYFRARSKLSLYSSNAIYKYSKFTAFLSTFRNQFNLL
jgi:hypothetical protein